MLSVLLPVDGSANSLRAVRFVIGKVPLYKVPLGLHLLNVQHPFPGTVRGVHEEAEHFHHDAGTKTLEAARQLLDSAGISYTYHIGVGDFGETIAHYTKELKIEQIVMGCRGVSPVANMLIGSVSTKVLHLVEVPVTLVK